MAVKKNPDALTVDVSSRVSERLKKRLAAFAKKEDRSESAIIRRALSELLDKAGA